MKIGFTGTQEGMTSGQALSVTQVLEWLIEKHGKLEVHHGVCVGADAQFHQIAKRMGLYVVGHPPVYQKKMAVLEGFDELCPPKHFLERNHDIVDETEYLIAAPKGLEVLRSGTWATIRYAKKLKRPNVVVFPKGVFHEYCRSLREQESR